MELHCVSRWNVCIYIYIYTAKMIHGPSNVKYNTILKNLSWNKIIEEISTIIKVNNFKYERCYIRNGNYSDEERCYNLSRLQKCWTNLYRKFFFQNFIFTEIVGVNICFQITRAREKMSPVN